MAPLYKEGFMYSVLLSKVEHSYHFIEDRLKELIKSDYKVAVIPWAFPSELDSDRLINEYFKKGERRYNKYLDLLLELGIKSENIVICNCYSDSKEYLKDVINKADLLVIPGGNPEMLFSKVVQEKDLLYDIKYFPGIILGESAGADLQLKRYFITAKNNYYHYFAFYDGFGVLDDPFYLDVHSSNDQDYLDDLQEVADDKEKVVYAIFDDGAIIYNRELKEMEFYGNVLKFEPGEKRILKP